MDGLGLSACGELGQLDKRHLFGEHAEIRARRRLHEREPHEPRSIELNNRSHLTDNFAEAKLIFVGQPLRTRVDRHDTDLHPNVQGFATSVERFQRKLGLVHEVIQRHGSNV